MEDIRAWLFTMLAWNMHGGVTKKLSHPSITMYYVWCKHSGVVSDLAR